MIKKIKKFEQKMIGLKSELLIVIASTNHFFTCWSQQNGVFVLGCIAALYVTKRWIRIYNADIAQVFQSPFCIRCINYLSFFYRKNVSLFKIVYIRYLVSPARSSQRLQKASVPKFLVIVLSKLFALGILSGTWPTSKFFM